MINPSRCPPARYSSWRGNATNGSVTVSSKPVNENGDCIRIACYSIILCSQSNVIQTTLNRSGKPVKLIKGYFFPNDPPRLISFLSTVFGINVSLGTEPDGSVAFKTIAGQYEDKHSAYLYTFTFTISMITFQITVLLLQLHLLPPPNLSPPSLTMLQWC